MSRTDEKTAGTDIHQVITESAGGRKIETAEEKAKREHDAAIRQEQIKQQYVSSLPAKIGHLMEFERRVRADYGRRIASLERRCDLQEILLDAVKNAITKTGKPMFLRRSVITLKGLGVEVSIATREHAKDREQKAPKSAPAAQVPRRE